MAQQAKRIIESHRFHECVPGSDSLEKYAVALFSMSFSMRSMASPLRSFLATLASSSDTLRLPGAADRSLPLLAALAQSANVPLGMLIRFAAYSSTKLWARTSLTPCARNFGVYVVNFILSLPTTVLSSGSVRKSHVTLV